MEEKVELLKCLEEKICSGKATIDRLKLVGKIDGVEKLIRKIQQEIRFLEKVQSTGNVKKEHLQSTNLIHLNAIVARLFCANEPTNVMKPFKYQKSRLEVDIVCNGGASWVKVIARNARALTLISMGNGEYGQKSVLDQASSYLQCAKCYPYLYRPPDIVFHFAYGIEIPLATRLELMGVIVEGDRIPCEEEKSIDIHDVNEKFSTWMHMLEFNGESLDEYKRNRNSNLDTLNISSLVTEIKILNLDVSTLLAYVTNMTNGYDHFIYREPLLTQQAEMERKRPVKPILENIFEGKELIVCQTAYENFMNIIDVIGGPKETARAKELLSRVRIVNDIPTGRIVEKLSLGGKIKDRSRLVFATGENMKSITVSANEGFVRAARMQGIECTVFLHEPRSLSEIKEGYATKISPS
ncbi:UPF0415 protein C7orf25 homolog [Megachile rotundata]|uniref:UPF0415 protein C7orf25 homolog n=1 Tax=Megachile rotundata TaxID=143995 RepID=UPI000258E00A|nr:PREDICTED: UPF0415 protein C7orf25 homolog isoform X2 [Megachile rotundata]